MVGRLESEYKKNISKKLKETFSYKNVMEIPKLEKVVINMGVGESVKDNKKLESAMNELTSISGQKPIVTKAKQARLKLLGRKPKTAKEYEAWRKKQRQKFITLDKLTEGLIKKDLISLIIN